MSEPVPAGLRTFKEFWPYYVREHRHPVSRRLHVAGTSLALTLAVGLTIASAWMWMWLPLVCGYGFAWVGHFVFERNRPATFQYPLFSLRGDFVMLAKTLTGEMARELERHAALDHKA